VCLADHSTLYKPLELDAIHKPVERSLFTVLFAKIASLAIHQPDQPNAGMHTKTQRLVAAKTSQSRAPHSLSRFARRKPNSNKKKSLWARGGTQKSFIRGGSAPRSNPLPFYIPFFQKRHPFRIPFIGKRHPFHIPS